jgi:uncharacterized protein (TIGR03437 family)
MMMWFFCLAAMGMVAYGQVSSNASLSGKYYFRQVLLTTDGTANVTGTATGFGSLTFDGKGAFTISGNQLTGSSPGSALTGAGTYTVSPGGFVTMTNPLKTSVTINARLGVTALVGSSTEAGPTVFDMFVAVPAPTTTITNASLNGAYYVSSLEFPNGGLANIRSTNFMLTANGAGGFKEQTVTGQAANLSNNLQTQTVGAMTYSLSSDGTGTVSIPAVTGLDTTTQLITGSKSIYVAQDASCFIGGSIATGLHGLVIGVKAFASGATNSNWSGFYWAAGMRYDTPSSGVGPRLAAVSGSVHANGDGNSIWSRRTRQSDGLFDASPLITYSLNPDGSGTETSTTGSMDLDSTARTFSSVAVGATSSQSYELYFGTAMPPQSGSGVFLNPQGIFNSASFAPPGFPISPGSFITLFGTGFPTASAGITKFPIPFTLGTAQVTVNGTLAPIYAVTAGQYPSISAVVPIEVTGTTATIQLSVNNVKSNTVTVPLAPTSPGIFSLTSNGLGDAAIRHLNGTVVNKMAPASRGEVVAVYLTGLGATNPPVPNGQAASSTVLSPVVAPLNIYIEGQLVTNVIFAGLTPTVSSLYQLNIQIPFELDSGPQPIAIQTADGFTDIATIVIQ